MPSAKLLLSRRLRGLIDYPENNGNDAFHLVIGIAIGIIAYYLIFTGCHRERDRSAGYYAVRVGANGPAVYRSWATASRDVLGVSGAVHKKFPRTCLGYGQAMWFAHGP